MEIIHRKATKTENHEDIENFNSRKKRVAAYARVSTDELEQKTSFNSQINYYTKLINDNPDYELVKVYSDEGITGTSTKQRIGLQEMIRDVDAGKIDLIYTKSVSRFARNVLDTIRLTREFRDKGVYVIFENDHIDTRDIGSELTLTIMASMAQSESGTTSKAVRWGQDKSRRAGNVSIPYNTFLGYRKGADGRPEIVEEEAKVIRKIYDLFIIGYSYTNIADYLDGEGILTPKGNAHWSATTIHSILTNEKYKGDARLLKTYSLNFLNKKRLKNNGEKGDIYIRESHAAIIDPDFFDMVQVEIQNRMQVRGKISIKSPLSNKLICADCGTPYGHKIWNSRGKQKYDVWNCNTKYNKDKNHGKICNSANLREEIVKQGFVLAMEQVFKEKDQLIQHTITQLETESTKMAQDDWLTAIDHSKAKAASYRQELDEFCKTIIQQEQTTDEQEAHRAQLIAKVQTAQAQTKELEKQRCQITAQITRTKRFLERLKTIASPLQSFEKFIWLDMIDHVDVSQDKITYIFWNGTKISYDLTWLKHRTVLN